MNDQVEDEVDFPRELIEETEGPPAEEVYKSLYKQVMEMTVAEKIKLALTGNREARNLLLKDVNKVVLTSVVNSPKITDDEIIKICQSRTVSEEVLKMIAARREMLKKYPVKLGLATNPKTPVPLAVRLLNSVSEMDLRNIAKSKNVSSVVSRVARKILGERGKL